jgi:hypothetical protein
LPVEVFHIPIDESIVGYLIERLAALVEQLHCAEVFNTVVFDIVVHKWKFKGHHLLRVVILVVAVSFDRFSLLGRGYSLVSLYNVNKLIRLIGLFVSGRREVSGGRGRLVKIAG